MEQQIIEQVFTLLESNVIPETLVLNISDYRGLRARQKKQNKETTILVFLGLPVEIKKNTHSHVR